MTLSWHLYVMAFVYFIAGLNHFRNPRLYLKIIPPYFPNPKALNYISGLAEIILAIVPTHLYMYFDEKARMGLPKWVLLLRMPLQLFLIFWAYQYT